MSNKDTIIEALTMQLKIEREGNLALAKLAKREWVGLTDEEIKAKCPRTDSIWSLGWYEGYKACDKNTAQAYLKGFDEGERRYRWLRKEYAGGRETYLAECIPSENALDEYIDRQMAKTSIKTERWSGK
jgi:hypothetical protein